MRAALCSVSYQPVYSIFRVLSIQANIEVTWPIHIGLTKVQRLPKCLRIAPFILLYVCNLSSKSLPYSDMRYPKYLKSVTCSIILSFITIFTLCMRFPHIAIDFVFVLDSSFHIFPISSAVEGTSHQRTFRSDIGRAWEVTSHQRRSRLDLGRASENTSHKPTSVIPPKFYTKLNSGRCSKTGE